MNCYSKPNVSPDISLHDARITALRAIAATSPGDSDGRIVLEFADGYYQVNAQEVHKTGRAEIHFSGIDYDFSHVYLCTKCTRREVTFSELAGYVEKSPLEIIDETYGYNQSRLSGVLYVKRRWYDVEIEIYHFRETEYQWED